MISPATASLVVSVAKGVIKLGTRLDALLAEKEAVQGALVAVMPAIYNGPAALDKVRQLRAYLAATEEGAADPLGADRADLVRELKKAEPDGVLVGDCFRRIFPEQLEVAAFSPDAQFALELQRRLPAHSLDDPDTLAAAFQLTAGKDHRQICYAARIGLLVADVLAEYGTENGLTVVRDAGTRAVVQAVLERFARPELEEFTEWSPLLRHALGATLNGLLDARTALTGDPVWLGAVLDVLVAARNDPKGGDDFVLGLFQGRGYPLLVSKGLARAAEILAEDQADQFKQLAADFLATAAPLSAGSDNFRTFFADHWGDLLRAGLQAFERHGSVLLADQPELLRDALTGIVRELAQIPKADLLSNETLFRLGDAVIAAVAAKPELLAAKVGSQPWLRALLASVVNTIDRDGLKLSFSREGLETIVQEAVGVLAAHPELIVDPENATLVRDVVGGILRAVSDLPSLDARNIAEAAASGTLRAIAENPGLMDTRYATLVADFSGRLAELVQARTLTGLDAAAIASVAVETLLRNPALFDEARSNLAAVTLDALLKAAGKNPARLLAGQVLVATLREVLAALARSGKPKLQTATAAVALDRLSGVVGDALAVAEQELGRSIDLSGVPPLVGALVGAWARGDLAELRPGSPGFDELLVLLLNQAAARALSPS